MSDETSAQDMSVDEELAELERQVRERSQEVLSKAQEMLEDRSTEGHDGESQ